MQIPNPLHHFTQRTLLVIADHVHAQFWIADGDQLEQVAAIAYPFENIKSDREGSFTDTDHGSVSAPEPKTDLEHANRVCHRLVEEIEKLDREHSFELIHLAASKDIAGPLDKHLPPDLHAKITKRLDEDLMKMHITDVLARFYPAAV